MNSIHKLCICLVMAVSFNANSQLTNLAENSVVFNQFEDPAGVASNYGDLLFSNEGDTAYLIVGSEQLDGEVLSATVSRDSAGNVTGFSTFSTFFAAENIDTGLTFAPGSDTLFYHQYDTGIGQRDNAGNQEIFSIVNYDDDYGGLAFIPEPYTNGGKLLKADYTNNQLWMHDVTNDGDGTYSLSPASLVSDTDTEAIGDIEYITNGPLANHIIAADYTFDAIDPFNTPAIITIEVDATTGLPIANPISTSFAIGVNEAWGLSIDPITGNLWLIDFGTFELTQIIIDDVIFKNGLE